MPFQVNRRDSVHATDDQSSRHRSHLRAAIPLALLGVATAVTTFLGLVAVATSGSPVAAVSASASHQHYVSSDSGATRSRHAVHTDSALIHRPLSVRGF